MPFQTNRPRGLEPRFRKGRRREIFIRPLARKKISSGKKTLLLSEEVPRRGVWAAPVAPSCGASGTSPSTLLRTRFASLWTHGRPTFRTPTFVFSAFERLASIWRPASCPKVFTPKTPPKLKNIRRAPSGATQRRPATECDRRSMKTVSGLCSMSPTPCATRCSPSTAASGWTLPVSSLPNPGNVWRRCGEGRTSTRKGEGSGHLLHN